MKEKIEILIANIREDLDSIKNIESEYNCFEKSTDEIPDRYEKMVLGYLMHNFYNACENTLLNIAKTFENNIEPESWHKSILKRMKLKIDDIRPAVISDKLYKQLDEFRAFRHVFRHLYSAELDWEKEKIVANKFNDTINLFNEEMKNFISILKKLANQ